MTKGFIPGTIFEEPFQVEQANTAITATAGGGQPTAYQLTTPVNRVTTVASANDSVKLPSTVGQVSIQAFIANAGANSMNVYPATGEQINALGVNAAFAVAAGKTAQFIVTAAGQWHAILSA